MFGPHNFLVDLSPASWKPYRKGRSKKCTPLFYLELWALASTAYCQLHLAFGDTFKGYIFLFCGVEVPKPRKHRPQWILLPHPVPVSQGPTKLPNWPLLGNSSSACSMRNSKVKIGTHPVVTSYCREPTQNISWNTDRGNKIRRDTTTPFVFPMH